MSDVRKGREANVRLMVLGFHESPENVSKVIGIAPTKAWRAGDPVLDKKENKQPENGWMLNSPVEPKSGDADAAILALVSSFPSPEAFFRLPKGSRVQVTCTLYGYSERPWMYLSNRTLSALAAIGADLDVDIYDLSFSDDSDDERVTR
jgi:hypothetical protein